LRGLTENVGQYVDGQPKLHDRTMMDKKLVDRWHEKKPACMWLFIMDCWC